LIIEVFETWKTEQIEADITGLPTELVPKKYRFRTLAYLIFANHISAGSILVGYAFVAYTKPRWRSMYWWCFAFETLSAILLFFFYHPPTFETKHSEDHKTKWQLMKEIDYVGLLLFTAGCLFILLGLNWVCFPPLPDHPPPLSRPIEDNILTTHTQGGSLHPWKSSWTIGTIVAGGVCLILLGFWEAYMPLTYPILPPHLFVQWRRFTSYLVVCFVVGMSLYSLNVIWPQQSALLFIPADKTIIRGVYASLANYGVVLAGYYCVLVMYRIKHEKTQIIVLLCVVTALLGSMSTVGVHDKGQAIATVILIQAANLPVNPLSFGMVGLHLVDQTDM
jgi:MFS family permease